MKLLELVKHFNDTWMVPLDYGSFAVTCILLSSSEEGMKNFGAIWGMVSVVKTMYDTYRNYQLAAKDRQAE